LDGTNERYSYLSIEVLEIANENEVTIDLASHSIQYAGANVQVVRKNIGLKAGRYVLHRASVAYGDDCVSHWTWVRPRLWVSTFT
jgi:hypothetical protein